MTTRRTLLATSLALPALARGAAAQGQWPERVVRVIVPWPPGGSTDVMARILSEQLSQKLGQNFVVENRPGAGGNIGHDAIAKAAPDGYTQGPITVGGWSINQYLYSRLPYDPDRDITPISMHWELPNILVVSAQHNPAQSFAEFVTWAKAQRNGVSYGSPGVGTTGHLSGSMFCNRMGLDGQHVPFRGAAQIIPALLSGDLTFALDNLASYVPVIAEGRLRAFVISGAERWPTLPNIPVMREVGVEDFVVTSWCAWAVPSGVPRPIINRVNAAMKEVTDSPEQQQRFLRAGARTVWATPEDTLARARRERSMWQELVRISGARLE